MVHFGSWCTRVSKSINKIIKTLNNYTLNCLSMESSSILRTRSDISYEFFSNEAITDPNNMKFSPLSEVVELAKCECCSLSEEYTLEYIDEIRGKFSGKLMCGLCGEAVKEEMEKNGGQREQAVEEHMNDCVRFNSIGRAYPVLYQAEAVRKLFKKTCIGYHGKNVSTYVIKKDGIARSSSCIPAIAHDEMQGQGF